MQIAQNTDEIFISIYPDGKIKYEAFVDFFVFV